MTKICGVSGSKWRAREGGLRDNSEAVVAPTIGPKKAVKKNRVSEPLLSPVLKRTVAAGTPIPAIALPASVMRRLSCGSTALTPIGVPTRLPPQKPKRAGSSQPKLPSSIWTQMAAPKRPPPTPPSTPAAHFFANRSSCSVLPPSAFPLAVAHAGTSMAKWMLEMTMSGLSDGMLNSLSGVDEMCVLHEIETLHQSPLPYQDPSIVFPSCRIRGLEAQLCDPSPWAVPNLSWSSTSKAKPAKALSRINWTTAAALVGRQHLNL